MQNTSCHYVLHKRVVLFQNDRVPQKNVADWSPKYKMQIHHVGVLNKRCHIHGINAGQFHYLILF